MTVLYPLGYAPGGGPGAPVPLATIQASTSWRLLHPEVQRRAEAILVASGGRLGFGQGWRDPKQADAEFVKRHHIVPAGTPGAILFQGHWWALNAGSAPLAPSDRSFHCPTPLPQDGTNLSMAIDFVGDMAWFDSHCSTYGFVNRISGEIWHGQPVEFPHARGDFNKAPLKYPLHTWPLTSTPDPTPPEDEDMARLVKCDNGDAAAFAVSGITLSWIDNPDDLATAQRHKTVPNTVEFWPLDDFKAYRCVGRTPPGWSTVPGVSFREVI